MVEINTVTNLDQQSPHEVTLADGSTVIFWVSENGGASPDGTYSIRGQLLDDSGALVGTEFTVQGASNVNIPGAGAQLEDWDDGQTNFARHDTIINPQSAGFDVAVLSDGNIAVVFVEDEGFGTDTGDAAIVGTTINVDTTTGVASQVVAPTLLGTDTRIVNTDYREQMAPEIDAAPDGGFVLIYQNLPINRTDVFPQAEDFTMQVFDNNLEADTTFNGGSEISVSFSTNEYGGNVHVLDDGTGTTEGYFIAGGDDGINRVSYRIIDTSGTTLRTLAGSTNSVTSDVEQLSNGNVAVANSGWAASEASRIQILSYDIGATTLTSERIIFLPTGAYNTDLQMVDGGFHAAWVTPADDIQFAFFDNAGNLSADGIQNLEDIGVTDQTGEGGRMGHPKISVLADDTIRIFYHYADDGSESGVARSVVCFRRGTMIETARGAVPIEDITPRDLIWTVDSGFQSVKSTTKVRTRAIGKSAPIRIEAGVLGENLPCRTVYVTRQHRVLISSKIVQRMLGVDQVLVPAKDLVDIKGVEICEADVAIEYYHLVFGQHELVVSSGIATESLYLGKQAQQVLSDNGEICESCHENLSRTELRGDRARNLVRRHIKNSVPLQADLPRPSGLPALTRLNFVPNPGQLHY